MKKKRILLTDTLIKDFVYIYQKDYIVDKLWEKNKNKINFKECEGMVASGVYSITDSLMEKLTNLKIISLFGVGYDNVNLKLCKERNISVANTMNVLTKDVADLAIALVLAISRNIFHGQNYILQDKWTRGPMDLTTRINGKKVGIVGLGKIGKEFAKRAESFSMEILYFGPNKKKSKYKYIGNLKKMASMVDYLVITCTGGKKTEKLINAAVLQSMKKHSYLVNVSRGTIIDEKSLINCLQKKCIKGAALDVFLNEPKINPTFKKLSNVILHPHGGSATLETRTAMAQLSLDNLKSFFKTGSPLHSVI